jgi:hypothetical protein
LSDPTAEINVVYIFTGKSYRFKDEKTAGGLITGIRFMKRNKQEDPD